MPRIIMQTLPLRDFGLWTAKEAAEMLGITPQTVRNWVAAGRLPVVIVGSGKRAIWLIPLIPQDESRRSRPAVTQPKRGRPANPEPDLIDRLPKKLRAEAASALALASITSQSQDKKKAAGVVAGALIDPDVLALDHVG